METFGETTATGALTAKPQVDADQVADPAAAHPVRWRRRIMAGTGWALAAVALFSGYLRMSRNQPTNSDGASNALQSWDMLHGNLLLHHWTVTDVSFYTNELVQYVLVESVRGLRADVINIVAALTYTMIVLLVAALARGRATGTRAAVRMAAAAAVVLAAPAPGHGYLTLLGSPAHAGTAVPVLLTWLVLDRSAAARRFPRGEAPHHGAPRDGVPRDGASPDGVPRRGRPRGWALPVGLALLLAWGQISDPLVLFTGAIPLALVSVLWLVRGSRPGPGTQRRATGAHPPARWRRGRDLLTTPPGRLLLAAVASVLLARGLIAVIRLAGGWSAHPPRIALAAPGRLDDNLSILAKGLSVDFGGYLPDLPNPASIALGVLHLLTLAGCLVALVVVALRAIRPGSGPLGPSGGTPGPGRDAGPPSIPAGARSGGDLVSQVVAVGVLVNLGAFVISTQPEDLLSARQIVLALPLGAVLVGRVFGDRLAALRPARGRIPVAVALLAMLVGFTVQAVAARPVAAANQDAADWLASGGYDYGLGHYWSANIITLTTGGRVQVVPVAGTSPARADNWESRDDWYDPGRHDARFVVLDRGSDRDAVVAAAVAQFGQPVLRKDFTQVTVLVYDHNLLVGLTANCVPGLAATIADCPR